MIFATNLIEFGQNKRARRCVHDLRIELVAPPSLVSTIKLRQAGFGDCFDTEDSLRYWFDRMREDRILPA